MVRVLWIALGLVLVSVAFILWSVGDRSGGSATGARLERMQRSPQWNADKGRFDNRLGRHQASVLEMSRKFFFGGNAHRQPAEAIAVLDVDPTQFATPPASGLRVTWLGHSTFLVEIDQLRVLIDPVWGERASPVTWAGPARFYRPPLLLESLPKIDVVLISHDHYDHLDSETIKALSQREVRWLVPLGVGAHLERWGVPSGRVEELDWWEQRSVAGVTFTATPARHFSGRFIGDQNATLWVGWALEGAKRRLFYSGDTALPGVQAHRRGAGPL